jgi:proliferating cell nuclear antigen
LTSNELLIRLEGELSRQFQLPLLDINEQEIKMPAVEYDTVIEVNSKAFKDILKDAALFGTSVTFSVKGGVLTVESKNTQGQLKTTVKSNKTSSISSSKEGKETTVKFSLSFLQNIVKEADGDKKITLEMKSDAPMRVSYPIGPTKIQFYLAHMLL